MLALRVTILTVATVIPLSAAPTPEQVEFFETRIRPVLAQDCYECHATEGKQKGGLVLDHRAALLAGGDSGAVMVPGHPDESLLLRAMRHEDEDLKMPKAGAKLEDEVLADFARWIEMGAPDPRDEPPSAEEVAADQAWPAVRDRRLGWWSFQPLANPEAPDAGAWSDHPVDGFLLAKMEEAGLEPAPGADRRTLIRRLSFALTGLPPTADEIQLFLLDEAPGAWERLVDRVLASPRFGERWARHWMDWVRYAETHGSEGDAPIPHAWRYRDYLIRALNDDVPYDRLVREHLAGDLLDDPRIDPETGLNESAIGPAHLRMVFHGFNPTDALDELVRFTDDQINVISKAFQGMTVSCARCHDHKFDPISQADYYAMFGIFASTRPATVVVDSEERLRFHRAELSRLKDEIREVLAQRWLADLAGFEEKLASVDAEAEWQAAADDRAHPLHAWARMRGLEDGMPMIEAWDEFKEHWLAEITDRWDDRQETLDASGWNLASPEDAAHWFGHGNGLADGRNNEIEASLPGEFHVLPEGDRVITGLYPGGVYTHLISDKHSGVLLSPRFKIEKKAVSVRILGGDGAFARLVVQNYPIAGGSIYTMNADPAGDTMKWVTWDTAYWEGDEAYVEIVTREEILARRGKKPDLKDAVEGRSYFGVAEVVLHQGGKNQHPSDFHEPVLALIQHGDPVSKAELAKQYVEALRVAVEHWRERSMSDEEAALLDWFVRNDWLSNSVAALGDRASLVQSYRGLEAEVPIPRRAPGVLETAAFDQPLYARGDHKKPLEPVPRRFLEAIDPTPYDTPLSGRLEFAESLLHPENPLTARIAVNRLWHYLFGRGLCATVDNFGRMGEKPSHPELLDYLARRFVDGGWSIKEMIRFLASSEAYRMSSLASAGARQVDPDNRLLSHFNVRRLDGEAVRDSLLAVSGALDETMHGPGDAPTGPSRRRSVYLTIKRNDLNPFLGVFDAPEPGGPKGRRDSTNVPAQSLAMLNDPFVIGQAAAWGKRLADGDGKFEDRADALFVTALGRSPSEAELDAARNYVAEVEAKRAEMRDEAAFLHYEIAGREAALRGIVEPVRERLLAARGDRATAGMSLDPMALWDFEGGAGDVLGSLEGTLHGGAHVEGGALVLDGKAGTYVSTAPLASDLSAKTLEAWVILDLLEQRGGGVVSVQNLAGNVFDAIVIGERIAKQWHPGSNTGLRSNHFGGPDETEAGTNPVHVAIVYRADGTIEGYRNGAPYGNPYRSEGPVTFRANESQVLFGNRHGSPAGNHLLTGKILEARLYDRALSPEEIAVSAGTVGGFVSGPEVLAALSDEKARERETLQSELVPLKRQLARLEALNVDDEAAQAWQDLVHAVFNFKEFIYLK